MLTEIEPTAEAFKGDSPEGAHAKFVIIDGVGFKMFRSPYERDRSLAKQSALNCRGLAPEPGSKFDIQLGRKKMFGHATEVAEVLIDYSTRDRQIARAGDRMKERYSPEEIDRVRKLIEALKNRLIALGCFMCDDHEGNYGFISDNLVVIDCENVSFPYGEFP